MQIKAMEKRGRFILAVVVLGLFWLCNSSMAEAGYCANYIVDTQFCYDGDVDILTCCPDTSEAYEADGYPADSSDCRNNYFDELDASVNGRCDIRCCFIEGNNVCQGMVAQECVVSGGTVSTRESCADAMNTDLTECRVGCCCYRTIQGETSGIVTQSFCNSVASSVFNNLITAPVDCTDYCNLTNEDGPIPGMPACNDSYDNDGDGDEDYPQDADCLSEFDRSEHPVENQCSDGVDNDNDRLIDSADTCCLLEDETYDPFGTDEDCETFRCAENVSLRVDCDCYGSECHEGQYCCPDLGQCLDYSCDENTQCVFDLVCKDISGDIEYDANGCPLIHRCMAGVYDTECKPDPDCGLTIEICDNDIDDDSDGKVDCNDADCIDKRCSLLDINACEGGGYWYTYSNEFRCCLMDTNDCSGDGTPDTCGECSCDITKPAPTIFEPELKRGEREINVSWYLECEVDHFNIWRSVNGSAYTFFIGDLPDSSLSRRESYIDSAIAPKTNYCYRIQAVYDDALGTTKNSTDEENCIYTGDEICMQIPYNNFCVDDKDKLVGPKVRRGWCDNNNNFDSLPCDTDLDDFVEYLCMGPYPNGEIKCIEQSECDLCGTPFNMYSYEDARSTCSIDNEQCKDIETCFYDFTMTTIDKYTECMEVSSCYDYRSQDACSENKCLSRDCEWRDLSSDMIDGVCLEIVDYYRDCDDCNRVSQNTVFGACTLEKCRLFGDGCYLDMNGDCTESVSLSCNDYQTEAACTNGVDVVVDVEYTGGIRTDGSHEITTPSQDDLHFGVCKWDSDDDRCFKDANYDGVADWNLPQDIYPPKTTILTPHKSRTMNVTFAARDAAGLGVPSSGVYATYFCLSDTAYGCYPDIEVEDDDEDWISLGGGAGVHYVNYYSIDKADNLEVVQSYQIELDMSPPVITIVPHITPGTPPDYEDSRVVFEISTDEEAICSDILEDTGDKDLRNSRGTVWNAVYDGLEDGHYTYTIECTDLLGNKGSESVTINIDADKRITGTSPSGPLDLATVTLSLSTTALDATCKWDTKDFTFGTQGNVFDKQQQTVQGQTIYVHTDQFSPTDSGMYSIVVKCLFDNSELSTDEIEFVYDILAPTTTILDAPGGEPLEMSGFYTQQGIDGKVFLGCNDTPEHGFGCAATYYCSSLGSPCTPGTVVNWNKPVDLADAQTGESVFLCYYSQEKEIGEMGGLKEEDEHGLNRICREFRVDTQPPVLKVITGTSDAVDLWDCTVAQTSDDDCWTDDSPYTISGSVQDPDAGQYPSNTVKIVVIPEATGKSVTYSNIPANNAFQQNIELENGTNRIEITITDRSGMTNPNLYVFYIHKTEYLGDMITLVEPSYGVSREETFDFVISTYKEAECRYSFYDNAFESSIPMVYQYDGEHKHYHEITLSTPDENPVYVKCRLDTGFEFKDMFELSYDTTNPKIIKVYLDHSNNKNPPTIVEFPIESNIVVETDDKAHCRLSKSSIDNWNTARIFDDYDTFQKESKIFLSQADGDLEDGEDYTFYILCENGAELKSQEVKYSFSVDTSLFTGIEFVSPPRLTDNKSFSFIVQTTKQARQCRITIPRNGTTSTLTLADDTAYLHRSSQVSFTDGEYEVDIVCTFSQEGPMEDSYTFIVDTTPPGMPAVDDGNYSIYNTQLYASWEAEEDLCDVEEYEYAIGTYSDPTAVLNWTRTDDDRKTAKNLNLTWGNTYFWSVKAMNELGKWSAVGKSDGVIVQKYVEVINETMDTCKNGVLDEGETDIDCGGPECNACKVNATCVLDDDCFSFNCVDGRCASASCSDSIKNQGESDIDCSGPCEKCELNESCFSHSDCKSGYCKIDVCAQPSCNDGLKNGGEEGIDCGGPCPNECVLVDNPEACKANNGKLDSDCDRIDDEWERANGMNPYDPDDADEDFDNDGMTNYQEYLNGTDPNVPDKKPGGSKLWLWILIIFIAIGVLGTGSYYGYMEYSRRYGGIDFIDDMINSFRNTYNDIVNGIRNSGLYKKLMPQSLQKPAIQKAAFQSPGQMRGQMRSGGPRGSGGPASMQQLAGMAMPPGKMPAASQLRKDATNLGIDINDPNVSTREIIDKIRKKRQEQKQAERQSLMSRFNPARMAAGMGPGAGAAQRPAMQGAAQKPANNAIAPIRPQSPARAQPSSMAQPTTRAQPSTVGKPVAQTQSPSAPTARMQSSRVQPQNVQQPQAPISPKAASAVSGQPAPRQNQGKMAKGELLGRVEQEFRDKKRPAKR